MAEMMNYAIDLRSMTQSRGSFTFHFVRYEECPPAAQAEGHRRGQGPGRRISDPKTGKTVRSSPFSWMFQRWENFFKDFLKCCKSNFKFPSHGVY